MNKLILNPLIVMSKDVKGYTMFDGEKSAIISLNETGSYIMKLIIKGKNEAEIIKKFALKFKISQEVARNDFSDFLVKMKKRKLLITEEQYKKMIKVINFST